MNGKLIQTGSVLNLYKNLGETPRERIERLRSQRPEYQHEVLSYAGRLDPMAEGVLICLVGSANKTRDVYLNMSKEYVLNVLFGFSTDTYDILGKVVENTDTKDLTRTDIQQTLNEFRGTVSQEYPPFSSKTLEGKPLFAWARAGAIGTMILPRRTVTISNISLTSLYRLKERTFLSYIESSIEKVQGNFRQEEVIQVWKRALHGEGTREFPCATIEISCSSGTYARSIAHALGEHLKYSALAIHILRTKVGEYQVKHSLR